MKNILSSILIAGAIALALVLPATATGQNVGLYQIVPGGTATVLSLQTNIFVTWPTTSTTATNTFGLSTASNALTVAVSDFDFAGITWSSTAINNTTTNVGLACYRSYDFGNTYEVNPFFTWSSSVGSPVTLVMTNADVHTVTRLAFVMWNAGTAVSTNALLEVNLKATKVQQLQAGIYSTTATPTPIVTSTNWVP